ncbi:MAG TPA: hydroxymethylbilane synthase [Tepidisphaeraceae bacterium]|jgi:hydroxymethylbilane synthase|nr:hydroxymethylbilane synthase [Tepidisphaeraceae bacterium]
MTSSSTILRLGTRASLLARTQSGIVAADLERAHPGLRVELVFFKTSGDVITEKPLHEFGGKGLFTKELEQALLDNRVDFAVHSFKDMPTTMPLVSQEGLVVAAVPKREDPRDLLVAKRAMTIADLPPRAKVGTGSLRRRCQLLHARPDLQIEPIRGNIDTRLRKQREGEFDAIVLALAGVRRTNLFDESTMAPIADSILLSAPGQGALALQCRRDDQKTGDFLAALNDPITAACAEAERALVALLQGDCLSPIAALAEVTGDRLTLRAAVGARGGNTPVLLAGGNASSDRPGDAAAQAFASLAAQGVMERLHGTGNAG